MPVDPSDLLPTTVRRLDLLVADAQSVGQVPSLVAGVVRDGRLVHLAGAGDLPRPDADTQYRIGSISKTLTAVLTLRLRDAGLLDLADPLARYLPDTPAGALSIRQLLGHVSGLQREPDGEWWERSSGGDIDQLLGELTPDKLAGPPYRGHHYSNLAYGLLGAVLAQCTGTSWARAVQQQILDPLGMTRTTYTAQEPFARGYVVHPWHGTLREEPRLDAGAMAPAGQLWSTVRDLGRWAAFLADPDLPGAPGASPVLAADTMAEMCRPVTIVDPESWTAGQGLGLQMWRRGERVYIGHTGSMPGYLAVLAVHRATRTGVVVFANAYTLRGAGIAALGLDLLTEVLDREPGPPQPWRPGAAPPPQVEELTGRWWWMGREYEASYRTAEDELVLRAVDQPGHTAWRFTGCGTDRWRCHSGMNDGELLTVRRTRGGAVCALDIATFVFTREAWPSL